MMIYNDTSLFKTYLTLYSVAFLLNLKFFNYNYSYFFNVWYVLLLLLFIITFFITFLNETMCILDLKVDTAHIANGQDVRLTE